MIDSKGNEISEGDIALVDTGHMRCRIVQLVVGVEEAELLGLEGPGIFYTYDLDKENYSKDFYMAEKYFAIDELEILKTKQMPGL